MQKVDPIGQYIIPFGSSSEAEVIHVTMQTQVKNSKWHIGICGGIILLNKK